MEDVQGSTEQKQEPVKIEEKKPGIFSRLINKLVQYRRVIEVSRKPDREEFTSSAKVSGAGILLIGFIGFIIYLIYYLVL